MIQAVIIDVDDTLVMTEAASFELENEVVTGMGLPPIQRDVHFQTWGQHLFDVIKVRAPGIDVETFRPRFLDAFYVAIRDGRLDKVPPEHFAALDDLLAQGKRLFVLTSRTEAETAHLLAPDHDLAQRAEAIYHKDNNPYHKPDPLAFRIFTDSHELKPEACVYIGDSVGDAASATEAGLHFIATLESGIRTEADFAPYQVDAFVRRFPEIVPAIAKLDAGMSS